MRRLFDNQKPSFKKKTILMLTHDFQPIIDFIYGGFFNLFGLNTPVNAKWLQNEDGFVEEYDIQKEDLFNTFNLTKRIAKDEKMKMPVRVVNLRKHIELMTPNFSEKPIYEVLSNLVHGREEAQTRCGEKLDEENFLKGCLELKEYFGDLSYDNILEELKVEKLLDIMKECDGYDRIIAIRLLFQRFNGLLRKLRKEYPAACKYLNETNHIENDYIFQLDPFKYSSIPKVFADQIEEFICNNIDVLEIETNLITSTKKI